MGFSRSVPWAHRSQAAALLAAVEDPDRGFARADPSPRHQPEGVHRAADGGDRRAGATGDHRSRSRRLRPQAGAKPCRVVRHDVAARVAHSGPTRTPSVSRRPSGIWSTASEYEAVEKSCSTSSRARCSTWRSMWSRRCMWTGRAETRPAFPNSAGDGLLDDPIAVWAGRSSRNWSAVAAGCHGFVRQPAGDYLGESSVSRSRRGPASEGEDGIGTEISRMTVAGRGREDGRARQPSRRHGRRATLGFRGNVAVSTPRTWVSAHRRHSRREHLGIHR